MYLANNFFSLSLFRAVNSRHEKAPLVFQDVSASVSMMVAQPFFVSSKIFGYLLGHKAANPFSTGTLSCSPLFGSFAFRRFLDSGVSTKRLKA